ncbi:MAG: hypothetical protein J6Y99_05350 [Bacteroidales bacterium]|nr:hypothetical protein [Bacteroidales bacterium]
MICLVLATACAKSIYPKSSLNGSDDANAAGALRANENADSVANAALLQALSVQDSMQILDPNRKLSIAVILPFNLASNTFSEDKLQMRSVEFYEGLLLSVNRWQQEGAHITVKAYDLGSRHLEEILTDEGLLDVQTIIAPIDAQQVEQVARFGEAHAIPVVSPFTFCRDLVEHFPHLYQLPTPKSTLYPQLAETILDQFGTYRVVFVKDSLFQDQVDPFPAYLQQEMDSAGRAYDNYIYNEPYSVMCMDSALNLYDQHVLYVLETPQRDAIRRFFPSLKNKLFLDANPMMANYIGASYANSSNSVSTAVTVESEMPDSLMSDTVMYITEARKVAILGYPEWQLYTNDFMEYFYDLNVWMFTKFYINPFDPSVQEFYDDFKNWYNRELMPLYPKYGMLGYDVTNYVVDQLRKYGKLGVEDGEEEPIETLQSAICFEQQGDSCYMNRGLYLVHFTPETTIEKLEIK